MELWIWLERGLGAALGGGLGGGVLGDVVVGGTGKSGEWTDSDISKLGM